jgi:choline dehydrogenase
LSVLGEGSFLSLLGSLREHAPDPITRAVARLAARTRRATSRSALGAPRRGTRLDRDPTLRDTAPRPRVAAGSSAATTRCALSQHRGRRLERRGLRRAGARSAAGDLSESTRHQVTLVEAGPDYATAQSRRRPARRAAQLAPGELVPWQAAFVAAATRVGYPPTDDHNNPELPCGVGPHAMNKVGGERMSAARCYLTPLVRRRDNLHVSADTHVRRILFAGGAFSGLEVERAGRIEVLKADRLVLSAGAIGTPAILLRSGVGPRQEVERLGVELVVDSPSVGRRVLDHPGAAILLAPRRLLANDLTDLSQPVIQTMCRATSIGSDHPFDLQLQPGSWLPIFGVKLHIVALMTAIGKPDGSGTMRLPSADPHAKPLLEARLLDHPRDVARVQEGLERLYELARQPELAELAFPVYPGRRALSSRARLSEFLPKVTGSGYHPCGTVPMAEAAIEEGAVDQQGRLRGVRGVAVADASIMPSIPSANTNLATLMIGERFGEWLREGLEV